jgi:hypothetical protein
MGFRLKPIANPCRESFEAMQGDERTRFCEKCRKDVHVLSEYTEEEGRALFAEARGARICVRFAKDSRGAVRFKGATSMTLAAAAAVTAASVVSCTPHTPPSKAPVVAAEPIVEHDMGDAIPDAQDRCPEEPFPADDYDGCPPAPTQASDAGTPR